MAFSQIMQAVNAMQEGKNKENAREVMQKLENEARQGDEADESQIQRWLHFMAEISTDVWDVAITTLSNPITGLGTAFQKIAKRAKEEKQE